MTTTPNPAPPSRPDVASLLLRAYEVVHHDIDCPAIGGNGDADCTCDAVPFLRDLEAALAATVSEDRQRLFTFYQVENDDALIAEMLGHIESLQAKVRKLDPPRNMFPRVPREG